MTKPDYEAVLKYARIAVKDSADSRHGYDRQVAMHDILNRFDGLTNSDEDEEFITDAVREAEDEYNEANEVEL